MTTETTGQPLTPLTSTSKPRRKPITKEQAAKAVDDYREKNPKIAAFADEHFGQRPYTLESANLAADLTRQRNAALSELDAIEAAKLSIKERMNADISAIQSRGDAELAGREHRAEDLRKIIAMAERALNDQINDVQANKAPSQAAAPTNEDLPAHRNSKAT